MSKSGLTARETFETETGLEQGSLGAMAHLGYAPTPAHELELLTFYTHVGDAVAIASEGYSEADGERFEATRLQFVERSLLFSQLGGFHRFAEAGALELRWQLHHALTERDEPDTRDLVYNVLEEDKRRYKDEAGSGERFFSALDERTLGAGVDLKLPFEPLAVTAGGAVQHSDRHFDARRFRFEYIGSTAADLFLPPAELFASDSIGSKIRLDERTMGADRYDATSRVVAAHAGLDITALAPVRLVPGVRYEMSTQTLRPGSPFALAEEDLADVDRTEHDVLPVLNAIWALDETQNVRAGYSKTLARPIFRELAPFLYYDFGRRRSITGNPGLEQTTIHNADLRWEWFPSDGEVISLGAFYKRFEDPIEQVVVNASAGDIGFTNALGADAVGGEAEARVSMGRLSEPLSDLRLGLNMAVIRSEVRLSEADQRAQTNRERPLQGQSPYVINASTTWAPDFGLELTLLYNVAGARIAEVGIQGLPDAVEQSQHRLDATVSQKLPAGFALKAGFTNLLLQPVRVKQGPLTTYESQPGLGGSLSVEWKP